MMKFNMYIYGIVKFTIDIYNGRKDIKNNMNLSTN